MNNHMDNIITFGLTGGICCGKSTVTKTLRSLGIPMVDADIVARKVVEPGTVGLREITSAFGDEYLQEDGTLNRTKLGSLIFTDKLMRRQLDLIMLPLINAESSKQIKALHDNGARMVGYDAALICEMGNADKYRPLIVVHCPQSMQIERLKARNSLTFEEAITRIEAQMSVEHKIAMADYTIDTSGSLDNSKLQTEKIASQLFEKVIRKLDPLAVDLATRLSSWEDKLEDALVAANPQQIIQILHKIKAWTHGYCITCGVWNDTCGSKRGCNCEYKGNWDD